MNVREKLVELIDNMLPHEGKTFEEALTDHLISNGVTVQENMKMSDEFLTGDKHMDNYELTPNTTTLENSYDEHIIKVEITFISDKSKSAEEIKKLLDAVHVLIESTKVFHHKGRKRRKK